MKATKLYSIFKENPIICTDTRKIKKGSIFFALKGKKFNGNEFALKAIENGCSYAIIDEKKYNTHSLTILVKNVLDMLQELAIYHRTQLTIPIIGITGTNGKTTSKELIKSILQSQLKTYATKGNLNNHIGVPLSILEINNDIEIAIIEMGANHLNEIASLCKIVQPELGVITNIGKAHLEGFKNIENIIKTKNELYQFIQHKKGHLFVNSDDKKLLELSKEIKRTTYGEKGETKGSLISNFPFINIRYKRLKIKSKLIGKYQFSNIMLAICIGNYFNISTNNIKNSIKNYIPSNNRSQIIKTEKNILIFDAYNANPSSMQAMIESFAEQNYNNKLCIIGDMLELGDHSNLEHKRIFELTKVLDLKSYFIGSEFQKIHKDSFTDRESFELYIKKKPIENKTILLKASRGIKLEGLVDLL